MITILDSSSQRTIQILTILLDSKNWVTIKELSERISVSEKTISEDLKLIEDYWQEDIGLQYSDLKSIRATNLNVSKFLDLQSSILLDSVPIKFIKSIFYHPNRDLNFHADHLHVSRSTLYRCVPIINDYLNTFDIKIDNNNALYYIYSDKELKLRRFFTTLFLEISGYHTEMFISTEKMFFLGTRIQDSYRVNSETLSQLQVHFYIVLYFVSIKREVQGFFLDLSEYFTGNTSSFTEEQLTYSKRYFNELTLDDFYRIEKSFLILRHSLNNRTDEHLDITIPQFLTSIYEQFRIEPDPSVYEELLYYLKDLYLSEKYITVPFHVVHNRFTYFSKEVLIDNPYVYKQIQQLVQYLSTKTSVNFNQDFDYILYILITLIPNLMLATLNKKLLVISQYSKAHAEFLLTFIQDQLNIDFSYFDYVECLSKDSFEIDSQESYHLIISNSLLPNSYENTIIINDFPSETDLEEIKTHLLR